MAGAFLHNIGRIGVCDGILLMPAKRTAEAFETTKRHVAVGAGIIAKHT